MRPDVHRISDLEVRGRESVFIGLGLVAGLSFGDVPPEFRVEFVQVYREFQGASGGYVAFRVYRKSGVIALVGEERRNSGSSVRSVVVRELR